MGKTNLLDELPFPIREAGQHFIRPIAVSTLYRWMTEGLRGVKLETVYVGGRRYTTEPALARFVKATNKARLNSD